MNNTVARVATGFTLFDSDNNTIARNKVVGASDWFGFGLLKGSDSNALTDNIATSISGIGFVTEGGDNYYSANQVSLASGAGIAVYGPQTRNNTYEHNQITNNPGLGIEDTTKGNLTAGTANTYDSNTCSGNGAGNSSPQGLC